MKQVELKQEQMELIKSQIAPKATDDELRLFLYQCKRTGLDPLARQIYAIHRKVKDENGNYVNKMTVQTSIDGFRAIAERSGDYAGQDEPRFEEVKNAEGKKTDMICKVTVYRFRGETRYPASVGVAYWSEYSQKDYQGNVTGMWLKMPHVMLSKVAEAVALRKAYPQDLSDLYTEEEMQQADNEDNFASSSEMGYIEMKLQTSILDHEERAKIEKELCSKMKSERARELSKYVMDNQQKQLV
jgi:phage recombination protein Bet